MRKLLLTLTFLLISVLGYSQIKTIYVSISGSDNNSGDESSPFRTIQFSIDSSSDGDLILVSSGTYKENISINSKELNIHSNSGPDSTIIDGNRIGRCVTISGTSSVSLQDFSLTNGLSSSGAGILISNASSVTIKNVNIFSNQSSYNGGGMVISGSGSVIIDGSKVYQNEAAHYGGGILSNSDNVTITNSLIDDNLAQTDGGGLYVSGSDFKLINSTIVNNTVYPGRYGAGMLIDSGLNELLLMNNLFYKNVAINSYHPASDGMHIFTGKVVAHNNYFRRDDITEPFEKSNENIFSNENQFVSFEDKNYNLIDSSLLIGKGISLVNYGGEVIYSPSTDINGNNRPSPIDSNPDIGAFENNFGEPLSSPTDITLSNNTIDENSSIGTEVGTLTSTDENDGDTHTYTLVSGNGDTDNISFTISEDKLLTNEVFDFESKSSYSIRVQTEDSQEEVFSKSFIIYVNDVIEDDDNDGVNNDVDTCPNTPSGEAVDSDGCSDSQLDDDNDGVMNNIDNCPNTPSGQSVNSNGCSTSQLDTDNDGVTDDKDTCPNTPSGEAVDSDGCSDSQLDDDNDGVMNNVDRCPDTVSGETVDIEGCSESQTLGVEDQKLDKSIKFYPNPVSNTLSIQSERIHLEKVEIYSYLGIKIKEIDGDFDHIQTNSLSKGIYIIKIYSEKGSTTRRLIKQ